MSARQKNLALASAILCAFGTQVYAAENPTASQKSGTASSASSAKSGAVDVANWNQAELKQGYSADRLTDMKAKSRTGDNIGDIKDILIDRNGKATAFLVSHGGVFGIGDKELRVPFNELKPDPKLENVTLPVTKENVEKYRVKEDSARSNEMKVSELMKHQVALRGGAKYGDVKDVIIGRDGQVKAIVVDADGARRGRYALPWTTSAYDTSGKRFAYDYEPSQLEKLRPFDYAALQIDAPGRQVGGTAGRSGEGTAGSGSSKNR